MIQYIIIHSQSPSRFLHLRFSNIEIFTFIFSILSGEQGMPGERGPPGAQGPKGTQGDSGEVEVTYIRWGKKSCPNSGATLVYEGKIKNFILLHVCHFYSCQKSVIKRHKLIERTCPGQP